MPLPMIVVDSDSLLMERRADADCSIYLPIRSIDESVADAAAGESPAEEEAKPPHTLAIAVCDAGNRLKPKQMAEWLIFNEVAQLDVGLLADVCDELMISQATAVSLMSDGSFEIHNAVRTAAGDWELACQKGKSDQYGVLTSDGWFHISPRTLQAEAPEFHAVDAYATYARHNDELSNNFDHYVASIDEIIENATIVKS